MSTQELQASIDRTITALKNIKRHTVVFLDEAPKPHHISKPSVATVTACCSAINLNGTPCKFKPKLGKFCKKHAS